MSVLSKPYPRDSSSIRKIIFSLSFGVFVFAFLFFFQPFGINQWKIPNKTLLLAGYGSITAITLLFHFLLLEKIFHKWFAESNWKVWKEIAWALWIVFVIGTCNLFYSYWHAGFSLTLSTFLMYQWITLLIGLFPVIVNTLFNHNRLQTKNLKAALELNKVINADVKTTSTKLDSKMMELAGDVAKESIILDPESILYIEAADNYVEVVWIAEGILHKKLLRNTLKNLESNFIHLPHIFRSHRSYLVNLNLVVKVSGNSQGYKLHFNQTEITVPVSRQLNETIKQKISNIHSIGPH